MGSNSRRQYRTMPAGVAAFLSAFLMALGLFSLPACATETGVRGTVLWGPVRPGPSQQGVSDEAPLAATFTVMANGSSVARFQSDKSGHFEVALPPGQYTIVPDRRTPVANAMQQKTTVEVPDTGYAEITIRLDSGMR